MNKSGKETKREKFTYTPKTSHKHIHKHQQQDHIRHKQHINDETATPKRTAGYVQQSLQTQIQDLWQSIRRTDWLHVPRDGYNQHIRGIRHNKDDFN